MKKILLFAICFFVLCSFSFSATAIKTNNQSVKSKCESSILSKDGLWYYSYDYIEQYNGSEESITLPTVIDGTPIIGVDSIDNDKVKHITVPKEYINIYSFAFAGLKELRSVTFSQDYDDEHTMARFDDYAFKGCPKLEKVVLPNRMVEAPFYDGNLKKKIVGGVLPSATFKNCPSLVDVTMPEGLVKIGSSTFEGCTSIEKIIVPEGVLTIDVGAFENTPSLKTLVLPSSIEEKGLNGALNGISETTTIVCKPDSYANEKVQERINHAPELYPFSVVTMEPTSIKGDVNNDGTFSIKDTTLLQKYLVKLVELSKLNYTVLDFNGDGKTNINDCTSMQRFLAKMT